MTQYQGYALKTLQQKTDSKGKYGKILVILKAEGWINGGGWEGRLFPLFEGIFEVEKKRGLLHFETKGHINHSELF